MSVVLHKSSQIKAPIQRVWQCLTDPMEIAVWYVPGITAFEARLGGLVAFDIPHALGTVEGEVLAAEEPHLLSWREGPGLLPGATTVTIRLSKADEGTNLEYEHSGFGSGPEWEDETQDHVVGWDQCLADLALLAETGIRSRRASRAKSQFGVVSLEAAAGLRVLGVQPDSCADRAGLRPGDLLIRLNGGPVFSKRELWFFSGEHTPGDVVTADWIRDQAVMSGTAEMGGPPGRPETVGAAPIEYGGNATRSRSAR
jgi:uncharacterized protein YndB with AHSA1/START domain